MVEGLRIVGSWDNWTKERTMLKTYNSLKGCDEKYFFCLFSVIYLQLRSNTSYEFKFKFGKQYIIDEKYPTIPNEYGTLNNHIIIYSEKISTPTGWRNPKITVPLPMNCKSFEWERIEL